MDQYLLQILKETNTIIIPDLGALTITNTATGEVMFMPFLKHDDGKLSAHIAQKEGIEENEAKNIVAKHVREIKTTLDKGDSYDMFEFGTFSKGSDGDIEFINWEGDKKTEAPKTESKVEKPVAATPTKKEEKKVEPKEVKKEATKPVKEEKPKVVAKPKTADKPKKEEPETKKKAVEKPKSEPKKEEVKKAPAATKKSPTEESKVKTPKAAAPTPLETKKETPVVPVTPPTPKKEMNIAEKEELAKSKDKLDKLKKEQEEKKTKKKRGAGFYMLIVFLLLIGAGATYVAIDYDNVKQHFSFLADKEVEKDEPKPVDEMKKSIGDEEPADSNEEVIDEPSDEEQIEDEPIEDVQDPEPIVEEPEPVVTSSGSNDQPFHIIAGAFSSADNAARLVEKIKGMGYPAKVIVRGNQNVVSVQSYATKTEAQAAIPSVQDAAPKGWVLEWR